MSQIDDRFNPHPAFARGVTSVVLPGGECLPRFNPHPAFARGVTLQPMVIDNRFLVSIRTPRSHAG